jgi:FAD/FMN-containing dehydrogenase
MLGVDIAARGSCTIGGNVATNAGGIRVLRYGMFRAQVAGLEAVLADGTVLSSLSGLPKDNAGYDLKQIFIGSEGTLGVVTRACLRLHPVAPGSCLALAAVASPQAALEALMRLRDAFGPGLTAFEMIDGVLHDAVAAWGPARSPIASGAPLYALIEIQGHDPDADRARVETALSRAIEDGLLAQTLIAASGREATAFWGLRERAGAYLATACGPTQGHDIAVAIDRQPEFLARAETAIAAIDPGARILVFGHFGDGNLHYIVESADTRIAEAVYALVADMDGSVAAEHGIGLDKKSRLPLSRSAAEISVMRRLKRALDPHGILNPGRVFDLARDGQAA